MPNRDGRSGTRWKFGRTSFDAPEASRCFARYGVTLVLADTAGKWPVLREVTEDMLYLRLHGDAELYASGTAMPHSKWARDIRRWISGVVPGWPRPGCLGLLRQRRQGSFPVRCDGLATPA